MYSLKEYLSRQSTPLLLITLQGLDYKKETDIFVFILEILQRRAALMRKYAPSQLAAMAPETLIDVMNSQEILTEDIIGSRSIIGGCLDILKARDAESLAVFTGELTDYLRKYEQYCCDYETWEADGA